MRSPFPDDTEARRLTEHGAGLWRTRRGDPYGLFYLPLDFPKSAVLCCIVADGSDPVSEGWEHVSVVARDARGQLLERTPTWAEMARVKAAFWRDDECVVQIHPPAAEHVNVHTTCLHLWRKPRATDATPPRILLA